MWARSLQEKYAKTVTARIMCTLDPLNRGYVDQRGLRRSNVIQAFHTVDMEEDINLVGGHSPSHHSPFRHCRRTRRHAHAHAHTYFCHSSCSCSCPLRRLPPSHWLRAVVFFPILLVYR
jgi:hypothetical protein